MSKLSSLRLGLLTGSCPVRSSNAFATDTCKQRKYCFCALSRSSRDPCAPSGIVQFQLPLTRGVAFEEASGMSLSKMRELQAHQHWQMLLQQLLGHRQLACNSAKAIL